MAAGATHLLIGQGGTAVALLVCGLVFAKAGWAERAGAVAVGLDSLFLDGARLAAGEAAPEMVLLALDVALGGAFLVLALRFPRLWLGGALLLQAGLAALHFLRFNGTAGDGAAFAFAAGFLHAAVVATLAAGGWASWRRRRRRARASRCPEAGEPLDPRA